MNLGTVVINEVVHPIAAVRLANGQVELELHLAAGQPFDAGSGSWIVFGPDGELVFRGQRKYDWGEKDVDSEWVLTLGMATVGKIGVNAARTDRKNRRRRMRL